MTGVLSARITARTQVNDTGCIVWLGSLNSKGYGLVADGEKVVLAHRMAWQDVHGPIPEGLTVDHGCLVKRCVNVDHMELVTLEENSRRGSAGRRETVCAAGHPLTDDNVVWNGRGNRTCRTCRREWERAWYAEHKTHCRNGHEFTEANTSLTRDGHRVCRACRLERKRAYAAARAVAS